MGKSLLRLLLVPSLILVAAGGLVWAGAQKEAASEGGYPRAQTLICYMHARNPAPENMNFYVPNNSYAWHQSIGDGNQLWYVNTDAGKIEWWLATGFTYDQDYKGLTIKLRQNVKWSDGQPFTADDVVFTFNTVMQNPTMSYGATMAAKVVSVEKKDAYTVYLKFKDVDPRLHLDIDSTWGMGILPQHVWQGQDPLKFTNWPTRSTRDLTRSSRRTWKRKSSSASMTGGATACSASRRPST